MNEIKDEGPPPEEEALCQQNQFCRELFVSNHDFINPECEGSLPLCPTEGLGSILPRHVLPSQKFDKLERLAGHEFSERALVK